MFDWLLGLFRKNKIENDDDFEFIYDYKEPDKEPEEPQKIVKNGITIKDDNVRYCLDNNEDKINNFLLKENTDTYNASGTAIKLKKTGEIIEILSQYKTIENNLKDVFSTNITFVSGGAGTGKSYLIKYLTRVLPKDSFVLLAPTGVAAINIGGQTIHSFCNFPPTVIDFKSIKDKNYGTNYESFFNKIKCIKTIIIDEISMVRCDLLDGIDYFFRFFSEINYPFGGKKVLFVGDLFQLPPVFKKENKNKEGEDSALKLLGYEEPFYCFHSFLWKQYRPNMITLNVNKRQKDEVFFKQLHQLRIGNSDICSYFNENCSKSQNNVTSTKLTARKKTADNINDEEIQKLPTQEYIFNGLKQGEFNEINFPVPPVLKLKIGSKVMAVVNDTEKRFFNGSIGVVENIQKLYNSNKTIVTVKFYNGKIVNIQEAKWDNYKYVFDKKKRKLNHEVVGTYTQIPLILAWAITIHKSQGMTINGITVDLGEKAFASGQTYVALSRCPNIKNITLARDLKAEDINVDDKVFKEYQILKRNNFLSS